MAASMCPTSFATAMASNERVELPDLDELGSCVVAPQSGTSKRGGVGVPPPHQRHTEQPRSPSPPSSPSPIPGPPSPLSPTKDFRTPF